MIHLDLEHNFIYTTFSEMLVNKNDKIELTFISDSTQVQYKIELSNNLSLNRRLDQYFLKIVQNVEEEDKANQILFLPRTGMYYYKATNTVNNTLIEEGRAKFIGNHIPSVYK